MKSKRKWQLPQLLAGALIRTKLCFFQWTNMTGTEQRSFFFYSCQNIKWVQVLQECLQGWGQGNADLFSTLHCVCETPYVCLSICACVSTKPWLLFSRDLFARQRSTPAVCLCAPPKLRCGRKLEQKQVIVMLYGRGWGLPKQDQMQGSLWLLNKGGSVAPVEPPLTRGWITISYWK